jgi:hypothetical protein
MATNFYFNNFQNSQEQLLIENLIIESIKIYGQDMYYVPRVIMNKDEIYGADDISEYNRAYPVEFYIKSVDGFSGDGNFMSKFGLEIRDQVVFSIAQRVFYEEVGLDSNLLRPNEGDLIHFPLNNKLFKIMYVNKFEMFYQLGALQTWEITCELFEYSSEKFNTGIPAIDSIQQNLSLNIFDWALLDEDGERILDENSDYIVMENFTLETLDAIADNSFIQSETDDFLDFTEKDPFSENGTY